MTGFATPPAGSRYWLRDARVPACLLAAVPAGVAPDRDGLCRLDIGVAAGSVLAIVPAGTAPADAARLDMDGGQVWPAYVDVHTHLDKGHIWPRSENPDGSFMGARLAVVDDRGANWTPEDVRRRMDFSLRLAWAHGTRAVRTHIDSLPPQHETSWPVFAAMRDAWAGRIDLQGVSLFPMPLFGDRDASRAVADTVADHGGIFGASAYIDEDAPARMDRAFELAEARGLDLDFHVDEGLDVEARSLRLIAETARRRGFKGRINCGHCCSLTVQDEDYIEATLDIIAETPISIVSLPMCNIYLQDRTSGRTPRRRGVTLLHEFRARGIPVAVASDNTRDPFYGYGDLDMHEVFTQAARIAQLDRPYADWPTAVTATPAAVMGLAGAGRIAVGAPADLVLYRGRFFSELLSRPQHDRIVLRAGRAIDTALPDYRELDDLFEEQTNEPEAGRIGA
jgi:cytosine deaminase